MWSIRNQSKTQITQTSSLYIVCLGRQMPTQLHIDRREVLSCFCTIWSKLFDNHGGWDFVRFEVKTAKQLFTIPLISKRSMLSIWSYVENDILFRVPIWQNIFDVLIQSSTMIAFGLIRGLAVIKASVHFSTDILLSALKGDCYVAIHSLNRIDK